MKLKYKISIFFSITTAAIAILINAIIYYYTSLNYHEDFEKTLLKKEEILEKYYFEKDDISSKKFEEIKNAYILNINQDKYEFYDFNTENIEKLSQKYNYNHEEILKKLNKNQYYLFYEGFEYHYIGQYNHQNKNILIHIISYDIDGKEKLSDMLNLMIYENLITIILILIIGYKFSNFILTPFQNFIKSINNIKTNELKTIELKESKDEIYQLSVSFNDLVERIKTSIDLQHNFISHASHEFKNPLTSILGESEWILQKERESDEYKKSFEKILIEAEKLENLTNELFKLATTSFKEEISINEEIHLNELILDIISENSENVTYTFNEEYKGESVIKGNWDLLKIAFSNIIDNCIKFSEKPEIDILIDENENDLRLTISDNGVGIPSDQLKFIYNPFFRASNVIEKKGFGIGMPLTKRILDLHKFQISVIPNDPKGTKFVVEFKK